MNKSITLFLLAILTLTTVNAQVIKQSLTHDVYPKWKNISHQQISDNGLWVSYQINPQKGDGYLYLYNTETGTTDSIARGMNASIAPSSEFMVFQIAPQYDSLRKLKLDKTPKNKLPQDSLAIWYFGNDSIAKYAKVESFDITNRGESWIVYVDKAKRKKITKKKKGWWIFGKKKAPSKKAIKQDGDNIILLNPKTNISYKFDKADDWSFDYYGTAFFVETISKQDSTNSTLLLRYELANDRFDTIINKTGTGGKFGVSRDGTQVAFLFAQDTAAKNKVFDFYYWNKKRNSALLIADTINSAMPKGFCPSNNYSPRFSKNGNKLYFGTATKPIQEPKDTLLDNEKYHVDVWNYKDKLLQPQQKVQLKREKRRTFIAQYDIKEKTILQLADSVIRYVSTPQNDKAHFALGIDDITYAREQTWDGWYSNYYVINVHDGSKIKFLDHFQGQVQLSPNANYVIYFKNKAWFVYDIEARKHTNLTASLKLNFFDEEHDMPNTARAYGIEGWFTNDKYFVVTDRYDLWKIDPSGNIAPINITQGYGRENKIRFNEITYNSEHKFLNDENPHLLRAFYEIDKSGGYFTLKLDDKSKPEKLIQSPHHYYYPVKAKNSEIVIFRRSSVSEYPDLNITTTKYDDVQKISSTNPQQIKYNWVTAELMSWTAFDGQQLEGLIYKPEDFDSTKKYPMIVYFYEKYSSNLHYHYIPKPSHSIVNFTEYASNGYIVFVPDITYKTGHPAKSAYNAIVSGTEFMKKKPWIDAKRIGIQGQSWGGYQTAMLVTMTDIYACAESGAPVSNMTSAYGGIRWSSGMNRAFQYEKTQSRIGATLWDSLDLYIENSPIFHADKVNTPILIMHNDKDGAVPWYQGIEYFTGLRRLDKKVWMLTYNNDGHNLMKWPNRVDLSIRMMQFFNHYLQGKPMPEWMSKGLPAIDKGKKDAY